jgi:hypothetical protein
LVVVVDNLEMELPRVDKMVVFMAVLAVEVTPQVVHLVGTELMVLFVLSGLAQLVHSRLQTQVGCNG